MPVHFEGMKSIVCPWMSLPLIVFLFCLSSSSCNRADGRSSRSTEVQNAEIDQALVLLPNRNESRGQAIRSPDWQIVVCFDEPAAGLDTFVEQLVASKPFDKSLELAYCDTLDAAALAEKHTILLANKWPDFDAFRLPQVGYYLSGRESAGTSSSSLFDVSISPQELFFLGNRYEPEEINRLQTKGPFLKLNYYPNPWSTPDEFRLMHLWYAPDASSMAEHLNHYFAGDFQNVFWAQWAYQLETSDARFLGRYQDTTWRFQEPFVLNQEGEILAQSDYWRIEAASSDLSNVVYARVATYLEKLPDELERIMFSYPVPDDPIPVKLYASVERIGLQLGQMDTAIVDESGAVHLVVNEQTFGERSAAPFYALLGLHPQASSWGDNQRWGRALSLSPEGKLLARYIQPAREIGLLRPEEIVLADTKPEEGRSPIFLSIEQLATTDVAFADSGQTNNKPSEIPFAKGMTFAHEGYRVYNGYGGSTVEPSLDELTQLHVNSLAIVPYSFMRSPSSLRSIPVADFPGGENDAACLASAKAAHKRGWSVMLKPQIWLGGGSWPGDIIQDSEEGWQQFFDNYREWILHYAILADLHGLETFCLGTEMRHTTLQRPEEWRELVTQARRLYRGRLTYAANWGEEAEQLSFWTAFDVIGVNAYYPIGEGEQVTDQDLQAGVTRWLERVESIANEADRPLWLTEIGYRSVRCPWGNPHAEPGERPADEEAQMRCFNALCTVLDERESVSGMYIWKWPSHLSYMRETGDTGFSPASKPAAAEIAKFYR